MPRFEPHPEKRPSIVTGAATALAAAGHPVALGARRVKKSEDIAGRIRANGGDAVALPLEVSAPRGVHLTLVEVEPEAPLREE